METSNDVARGTDSIISIVKLICLQWYFSLQIERFELKEKYSNIRSKSIRMPNWYCSMCYRRQSSNMRRKRVHTERFWPLYVKVRPLESKEEDVLCRTCYIKIRNHAGVIKNQPPPLTATLKIKTNRGRIQRQANHSSWTKTKFLLWLINLWSYSRKMVNLLSHWFKRNLFQHKLKVQHLRFHEHQ